MNARIAVLENEALVRELVDSVINFSQKKGVSIEDALKYQLKVRIKFAKREGEKSAWEQRRDVALKIIKG